MDENESHPVELRRLFTVDEVADAARQAPVTIRRQIAKGAIRSVKVGGSRRIPEDALREYLGDTE